MSFFSKLFGSKKAKPKVQAASKEEQALKLPVHRMRGVVLAYYNYSPDLKSKEEGIRMAMEVFAGMNPDCFDRYAELSPKPMSFEVVTATGDDQTDAYMAVINKGSEVFPQCSTFVQFATTPIEGRNVPFILLTYYETEAGAEKTLTQITKVRPLIPA